MTDTATDVTAARDDDGRTDRVLAIVRDVLSRPDLAADDDVMENGGTSLSVVRILTEASRALGTDINPRNLDGSVSARSVVAAAR